MSDKPVRIPKYAGAGVSFAGVEIQDVLLIFAGVGAGLIAGGLFHMGFKAFVGIPAACYFLNTWYLDWKQDAPPGHLRAILYRFGVLGYSRAFPCANLVYVGDSKALQPPAKPLTGRSTARVTKAGGR